MTLQEELCGVFITKFNNCFLQVYLFIYFLLFRICVSRYIKGNCVDAFSMKMSATKDLFFPNVRVKYCFSYEF